MTDMGAADWDARYRDCPVSPFGDEPGNWLRTMLGRCDPKPRSALMIADGDGRNGAWLAGQGLDVTAIDLSPEATRLAEARDAAAGVTVTRLTADIAEWRPAEARWEMAGVLFLHGPADLRRTAVRRAVCALAPGSLLLVEGFAPRRGAQRKPGPDDAASRYHLDELKRWCTGFELIEATSGEVRLDDGPRHRGLADVIRFAAHKPHAG